MVKLRDVASVVSGISPPAGGGGGAARYVQIKDFYPQRRSLVRAQEPTVRRATPIEAGDVLVASRGEIPLAARPDSDLEGAYPALDVYLIRPDPAKLDADFLAAFVNVGPAGEVLRAAATGGSLPRIPKGAVEQLEMPSLPIDAQRRIGALEGARLRYASLIDRRMRAERRLMSEIIRTIVNPKNSSYD